MLKLKTLTLSTLFIFSSALLAVDSTPPTLKAKEAAPNSTKNKTLPNEADDSRNIPQPEVRIIRRKDTVIEEYRVNGHLRFIKITPSSGNPYYMVDTDGDGVLETREDNFANPPINQWILLEW